MSLIHSNLTWFQVDEPATGTNVPASPIGVLNRVPNELLENDAALDSRLTVVEGYKIHHILTAVSVVLNPRYHQCIICTNGAGVDITVTLPTTVGLTTPMRVIVKKRGLGRVTVLPATAVNIDEFASGVGVAMLTQYAAVEVYAGVSSGPWDIINNKGAVEVPVGSIVDWTSASSAPTKYIYCEGQSLERDGTYSQLYDVIGTSYGSVDGTHFNVPNAKGRFMMGAGQYATGKPVWVVGGKAGKDQHTLSKTQLPQHEHYGKLKRELQNNIGGDGGHDNFVQWEGDEKFGNTGGIIGHSGTAAAFSILNPYLVTRKLIKYEA